MFDGRSSAFYFKDSWLELGHLETMLKSAQACTLIFRLDRSCC